MHSAVILAKRSEGLFLKRYRCPAGFWTIGYGHLCKEDTPPLSGEEAATLLLLQDLTVAAEQTYKLCPRLLLEPEPRRSAIIDFTFNLGAGRLRVSTLRKRINAADWDGAAQELMKWVYGGGRKLPGLVLRRTAEVKLLKGLS